MSARRMVVRVFVNSGKLKFLRDSLLKGESGSACEDLVSDGGKIISMMLAYREIQGKLSP